MNHYNKILGYNNIIAEHIHIQIQNNENTAKIKTINTKHTINTNTHIKLSIISSNQHI